MYVYFPPLSVSLFLLLHPFVAILTVGFVLDDWYRSLCLQCVEITAKIEEKLGKVTYTQVYSPCATTDFCHYDAICFETYDAICFRTCVVRRISYLSRSCSLFECSCSCLFSFSFARRSTPAHWMLSPPTLADLGNVRRGDKAHSKKI